MIELLRRKLWESIYLNPVSPNDLMDNSSDPDYKSVEFVYSKEGLHITLSFEDAGDYVTAIYTFDNKQLLQNVVMVESGHETVVFDRQKQIKEISMKIKEYNEVNFPTVEIISA